MNNQTDKKVINEVFRNLRKKGFFAKQNFWCCQSCAWGDVPSEENNVVFYHNQDKDAIRKDGMLDSILYLAWRGDAKTIAEEFKSKGFKVVWDGTELNRIGILTDAVLEKYKDREIKLY